MSERFDVVSGVFKPQENRGEFVKPFLPRSDFAATLELFAASKRTGDAVDWIRTQERNVQKRAHMMYDKGLELPHPGILINFDATDLPLDALRDFLKAKNLTSNSPYWSPYEWGWGEAKKEIHQQFSSGGVLLMDRKIHECDSGKSYSGDPDQREVQDKKVNEKIHAVFGKEMSAVRLGVAPSLQLYAQSIAMRRDMRRKHQQTADGVQISGREAIYNPVTRSQDYIREDEDDRIDIFGSCSSAGRRLAVVAMGEVLSM
ncbi:hypothetical protein FWF74_00875 [Candidatus Saccharibacteria bacterium]|nr:hypothetical protein [Candidatus Saccharibacteria bacterium]MCL1963272.1 hypothetical protein [Candidatus Saccharibacteria bacterium]